VLTSDASRGAYRAAMTGAWRADLRADGVPDHVIQGRVARGDAVLGAAAVLIVPWLSLAASHDHPDEARSTAEREMSLLSSGAAIQNLLLALSAQGLASAWIGSSIFCREEARDALGVNERWLALGTVACGPMPVGHDPDPRPEIDLDELLDRR